MSLYDDNAKIYIGHLPDNISESDIEKIKYAIISVMMDLV